MQNKIQELSHSLLDSYHLSKVSFPETNKLEKQSRNEDKNKSSALTYISNGVAKLYYPGRNIDEEDTRMIGYISDLHIPHRLKQVKAEGHDAILNEIRNVASTLAAETDKVLLIGGDTSSDFILYEIFLAALRTELNNRNKTDACVIIILGNHELMCSKPGSLQETISKYRDITRKYKMYLLHNELLGHLSNGKNIILGETQLKELSCKDIRAKLRTADMIILGGIGFSGCNELLNAETGIYGNCLTRTEEMEESKLFFSIHKKVCGVLNDKPVIVLTHMPIECWNQEYIFADGFTYVSGHTHYNKYQIDGKTRFIADNQAGYTRRKISLKYFQHTELYDYFSDITDGIHEIKPEDQVRFYQGKGLYSGLTRTDGRVYLLKRDGYHCFLFRDVNQNLYILNGGSINRLKRNDMEYYYENMLIQIEHLRADIEKYTEVQEKLSQGVKLLGGSGKIHGAIVDIDETNHIYLNPLDGKITGYWASDTVNKIVYPTIKTLLHENCPWIHDRYKELSGPKGNIIKVMERNNGTPISRLPELYENTDIYKVSNLILKIQKLYKNILAIWVTLPGEEQAKLPGRQKKQKEKISSEQLIKEVAERYGMDSELLAELAEEELNIQKLLSDERFFALINSCDSEKTSVFYQLPPARAKIRLSEDILRVLTRKIRMIKKMEKKN